MELKVRLTKKQWLDLGNGRIKSDRAKGKVIEDIVKDILYQLGYIKVYKNKELQDQVYEGDLRAIDENEEVTRIEVKSSHRFYTKDKQAIDYKYFKKGTHATVIYVQKTTNTNLGWLYSNCADMLICFNTDSSTMYIIDNYKKLKENITEKIEKYESKLKNGTKTWYLRGHNNCIHKYLEGSVKKDSCKESLIVNLELSKEAIEYFGGDLFVINVIIEVEEDKKDNKKILKSRPKQRVF